MRILHVLDHSLPLHSGYVFRTLSILKGQRDLGWETIHVTSPKQGSVSALEEAVDGWHFFRTPSVRGLVTGVPGLSEIELMGDLTHRIDELVCRFKPHVIHAHSPLLNAIPALRVGRRLDVPVVYEVRAFWEDAAVDHRVTREGSLRYRLTRALETYVFRRADAITTICEGLRKDIVARGIPASKVTVIPNAVDVEEFRSSGSPSSDVLDRHGLRDFKVLGFIGSFYAYEGLSLLIRALPEIRRVIPETKILLVGGGPNEQELKALVDQLGLAEHVVFAGRVPHDQVQSYYSVIDVLVYPRLSMRLTELVTPLKPLEAMAQGRLLVASDVGGHRELITDDYNGLLFTASSISTLAEKVVGILRAPPEHRAKLMAQARAYVEQERTWRASVARYVDVYRSLVPDAVAA